MKRQKCVILIVAAVLLTIGLIALLFFNSHSSKQKHKKAYHNAYNKTSDKIRGKIYNNVIDDKKIEKSMQSNNSQFAKKNECEHELEPMNGHYITLEKSYHSINELKPLKDNQYYQCFHCDEIFIIQMVT